MGVRVRQGHVGRRHEEEEEEKEERDAPVPLERKNGFKFTNII